MIVITEEVRTIGTYTEDHTQTYEEFIEGYKQYKFEKALVLKREEGCE